MMKPVLAFSIVAVTAACFAIAQDAKAGGPCTSTCDIASHTSMSHMSGMNSMAGMNHVADMSHMAAMNIAMVSMPSMSAPDSASPAPSASPARQSEPRGAAADVMMQSMNDAHMQHGGHMIMTMPRPPTTQDKQRADDILAALRKAIEPYKDYRVAQAAGYKQFLPQLPQPMYHFTSWTNAFANEFGFDPTRPTSLMYKPVPGGFQLVGAMYTAPARYTDEQLNARVPLSIATWHLHTNLCLPPADKNAQMWGPHAQFGLAGSITDAAACQQAGGTFKPVIYNWMLHVWPLETDPSKVWATEEHPGSMDH